jgi:hypothetical protein
MSVKKSPEKKPSPSSPDSEAEAPQETKPTEQQPEPAPSQQEKPKPLTLNSLYQELQSLKQQVSDQANLIIQLQETLARKRKPVASNGKVQIRDKQTGNIYPSKNNAYQSLLKSGTLKELVDKGLFGDVPEKNTFGWYTLVREWPDRFEEVPSEAKQA